MIPLTDAQKIEYFNRSYKTVDGLWFVKCEERYGFDVALDMDDAVWQVLPKTQARKIKEFTGLTEGLDALRECFTTRLAIEGFVFETQKDDDGKGFAISISNCPWQNLLAKAAREHLGGKIGDRICRSECRVWAAEFGDDITYDFGDRICQGTGQCVMRFKKK